MKKRYLVFLCIASSLCVMSCSKTNEGSVTANPFDTTSESSNNVRDKIVVISDLHLGNDLAYSENVKHLKRLQQFLNEVRSSNTIRELVIAGDMFDEWYIPTRTDTYSGGSQASFIKKNRSRQSEYF